MFVQTKNSPSLTEHLRALVLRHAGHVGKVLAETDRSPAEQVLRQVRHELVVLAACPPVHHRAPGQPADVWADFSGCKVRGGATLQTLYQRPTVTGAATKGPARKDRVVSHVQRFANEGPVGDGRP